MEGERRERRREEGGGRDGGKVGGMIERVRYEDQWNGEFEIYTHAQVCILKKHFFK